MLETKLNDLDLEFMKIWSEHTLNDNIHEIMPNANQPRKTFDTEEDIHGLFIFPGKTAFSRYG